MWSRWSASRGSLNFSLTDLVAFEGCSFGPSFLAPEGGLRTLRHRIDIWMHKDAVFVLCITRFEGLDEFEYCGLRGKKALPQSRTTMIVITSGQHYHNSITEKTKLGAKASKEVEPALQFCRTSVLRVHK
jgi:hypothetical protein